jgi:hypothetical protein
MITSSRNRFIFHKIQEPAGIHHPQIPGGDLKDSKNVFYSSKSLGA